MITKEKIFLTKKEYPILIKDLVLFVEVDMLPENDGKFYVKWECDDIIHLNSWNQPKRLPFCTEIKPIRSTGPKGGVSLLMNWGDLVLETTIKFINDLILASQCQLIPIRQHAFDVLFHNDYSFALSFTTIYIRQVLIEVMPE